MTLPMISFEIYGCLRRSLTSAVWFSYHFVYGIAQSFVDLYIIFANAMHLQDQRCGFENHTVRDTLLLLSSLTILSS